MTRRAALKLGLIVGCLAGIVAFGIDRARPLPLVVTHSTASGAAPTPSPADADGNRPEPNPVSCCADVRGADRRDSKKNLHTVKEIYRAFRQGDVPTILKALADNVEWRVAGPNGPQGIPYAGVYRGHKGVEEFFTKLTAAVEITTFEPREFIVQGNAVVVLGIEKGRARPTGRAFQNDWVHVFNFRHGKVRLFREFGDTAALVAAFRK